MFDTGISSILKENRSQKQSPKYGPFKFVEQEKNPSKSVFQMQSEMRTRNLSNIGRFYHNQNSSIGSVFISRNGQYPAGLVDSKEYYYNHKNEIPHLNKKEFSSEVKNLPSVESQHQPSQRQVQIEQVESSSQSQATGFGWKSCILIMVSLLILAILSGFLYLVLTNQLEQAKYFLMSKARLWNDNEPQMYYGSDENSHPVKDTGQVKIPKEPNTQLVQPVLYLRKPSDEGRIESVDKINPPKQPKNSLNETKNIADRDLGITKPLNRTNTQSKVTEYIPMTKQQTNIHPQFFTITQETITKPLPNKLQDKPLSQPEASRKLKRNHKLSKN